MSFLYLVCNFHSLSSTSSPYLTSSDCGPIIAACAFFGNHRGTLAKTEPQKSAPRADLWTGSKWNHHRIPPSARPKCVCGCVWKSVSAQEKVAYRPAIHQQQDRPGDGDYSRKGGEGRGGEGQFCLLIYPSLSQVKVQDWAFHTFYWPKITTSTINTGVYWYFCVCVCFLSFHPEFHCC